MSKAAETANVSHTLEGRSPFVPSPVDGIVVRAMLRKSMALPFEITNRIIEFAEYWPCSHTSITYEKPAIFGRDSNKLLVRAIRNHVLFTSRSLTRNVRSGPRLWASGGR